MATVGQLAFGTEHTNICRNQLRSFRLKVLLSIGGWTGSVYFTDIAASSTTRANFVAAVVALYKKYNLDGIDLDWEYPGRVGDDCNHWSTADSANYLVLLKKLRAALPSGSLLTAAVPVNGITGPDGSALSDAKEFAAVFDWVNIMIYDIHGAWDSVSGPNAPFRALNDPTGSTFSVIQAIQLWQQTGFPASKIVVGTAFYGHSLTTTVDLSKNDPTNQYGAISSVVPPGDQTDAPWSDPCGLPAVYSGEWRWKYLRSQGVLTTPTTAASPWIRKYDTNAQTPWLFNPNTKIYISYDDPRSLAVKTAYTGCLGLKGVMAWELSQDNGELLAVLNTIKTISAGSDCVNYAINAGNLQTPPTNSTSKSSTSSIRSTSSRKSSTSSIRSTSTSTSKSSTSSIRTSTSTIISSKTSTKTSTSTSTAASTTSPIPTGCSTTGAMVCVAANSSPQYQECVSGSWLTLTCGANTVCQTNGDSIYCGFKTKRSSLRRRSLRG
ncbi:glycoside hydrolase superfamily [Jimgerdemannia flammicorona]|uniref:Glycoside hydrolase superfamily n=1 Tax=Jimgerdemannia flammicorona TaxID=994334 RepID=A0A433QDY5_9FUNG|nr:glycoside hydrolase superfamily [Jimgerdemannia flammicorona]